MHCLQLLLNCTIQLNLDLRVNLLHFGLFNFGILITNLAASNLKHQVSDSLVLVLLLQIKAGKYIDIILML